MKRKKNKEKKTKRAFDDMDRDMDNLIDSMAYLNKGHNIRRSKDFLDDMYLLND
jgi:hypothetical protein